MNRRYYTIKQPKDSPTAIIKAHRSSGLASVYVAMNWRDGARLIKTGENQHIAGLIRRMSETYMDEWEKEIPISVLGPR